MTFFSFIVLSGKTNLLGYVCVLGFELYSSGLSDPSKNCRTPRETQAAVVTVRIVLGCLPAKRLRDDLKTQPTPPSRGSRSVLNGLSFLT